MSRPRSERVFRWLVALFPRDFRERFGDEMTEIFRDQLHGARSEPLGMPRLWIRITAPLLVAAIREHVDAIRRPSPFGHGHMIRSLTQDLAFAARMLRKSPLFTAVAVACIAIGSGSAATIFSGMNAMVLRPLPAAASATRLFRVERKAPGKRDGISASYPYYEFLRAQSRTTDGIVAWTKTRLSVRPPAAEMGTAIYGNFVTVNFFSVLGGDAMYLGLFPQRVAALVTGVLGGAGLLLATAGLYGIIAHSAGRRRKEIGIRIALGARAGDVLRMVLRDGMSLAMGGITAGLVLAGIASHLIESFLYGVSPLDCMTFTAMSLVLAAVALLATWLPARRAAGANPVAVLRAE